VRLGLSVSAKGAGPSRAAGSSGPVAPVVVTDTVLFAPTALIGDTMTCQPAEWDVTPDVVETRWMQDGVELLSARDQLTLEIDWGMPGTEFKVKQRAKLTDGPWSEFSESSPRGINVIAPPSFSQPGLLSSGSLEFPLLGDTITVDVGAITGNPPSFTTTYQWELSEDGKLSWTPVSGETGASFILPAISTTSYWRCIVTITNVIGYASQDSIPTNALNP